MKRWVWVAATMLLALAVCGCAGDEDASDDDDLGDDMADDDNDDAADDDNDTGGDDDDDDDNDDDTAGGDLPWLFAGQGERAGIFDALGREVILRGVNFNHLGDYFQGVPELPTNATLGDEDWDDAAALGMNVIRLVTSWSAWEPERDQIDMDYVDRVHAAVEAANARGMYVVIDMHQDAWSKFVFTPVDEECPDGTSHQKGWDGAPEWATFTDGEPTCTPGSREQSPAVIRAWDAFYDNREGIRDELVELWSFIATEFAGDAGVAGFDLLNEPGTCSGQVATRRGLSTFFQDAIDAVRGAEAAAGARGHIIFFEPSVHGMPSDFDIHGGGLVFAAHNYFESIVSGPEGLLDFSFALYDLLGKLYRTTLWIGEFGSFSDQNTNEEWMARFAALEDAHLWSGGTWWQWEQECGDPHSIQYPATSDWIEQQLQRCGNARVTPTKCSYRGYPLAVPGRLTALASLTCDGNVRVSGVTDEAGEADLWIPSSSATEPTVTGTGIGAVVATAVEGGWRVAVTVSGEYTIEVVSPD